LSDESGDWKGEQFERLWHGRNAKGENPVKAAKFRQYMREHVRQKIPDIKSVSRKDRDEFVVAAGETMGARPGDMVRAEVLEGRRLGLRKVKVVERLEKADGPGSFSMIAINDHDIPVDFSQAALAQHRLERMEDFRTITHRFAHGGRAHGQNHEFLKIHAVVGMGAAVDDIHHGHRQTHFPTTQVFVQGLFILLRRRMGRCEGNRQDGIGAQIRLVFRSIELDHALIQRSLIGHILGSHPAINGYYEMHRSYQNADDVQAQLNEYTQQETIKPGSQYLFDKLLHNNYALDLNLLQLNGATVLVALRQPEASIKSIVHLFRRKPGQQRYADPQQAGEYYIQRIEALCAFCQQNQGRYFYLDAERLLQSPAATLNTMSDWLQLDSELQQDYQIFARTGKPRSGDSSAHIKSGKIRTERNRYEDIVLPETLLQEARHAYVNCRKNIIDHAIESLTDT